MKRIQLNVALAVLVIGLGAAVYFSRKPPAHHAPLTPMKADAVNRIVIAHPGSPEIKLEKKNGIWKLLAPVQADADRYAVNSLIGLATTPTKAKLDIKDVKLADLGLNPAKYEITLNTTTVAFGGVEPLNYRRYVRVGHTVYTIDDPPGSALDADYSDLVSKSLVPAGAQIQRIDLPDMTLSKGAKSWSVSPAKPRGTAQALQKLADGWQSAKSMWNQLQKGATPKGDRVTLHLKNGRQIKLIVAAKKPQFEIVRPDLKVRYFLSKALADKLMTLPPAAKAVKAKDKAAGKGRGKGARENHSSSTAQGAMSSQGGK